MGGAGAPCKIHIEVAKGIQFAPERAIHLALIVNELVTNAAKYAQPDNSVGDVWLVVRREGDAVSVSVRDAGIGLPADFDLEKSKGLGMRIVTALAKQLGATLTVQLRSPGSEFTLLVPFECGAKAKSQPARTQKQDFEPSDSAVKSLL